MACTLVCGDSTRLWQLTQGDHGVHACICQSMRPRHARLIIYNTKNCQQEQKRTALICTGVSELIQIN
eukprot:456214-Pelagomonas_calceolata.AAC.6